MIIEIVVQPAVMFSLPWMPLHTLKLIIILPTPHASRVVGMIAVAFELTQHVVERHQHIALAVLVDLLSASLVTPVASRNLLLYQSLPISIPYRQAILWRRKDDTGVGTTASGI